MAWARYDDELPMNKKVAALLVNGTGGCAALGLHLLANTWSRHNGTAGFIPRYVPGLLVADPKLGLRYAILLANVGMFDTVELDGWMIHDFDVYSDPNDDGRPASERKREISAKRAESGRKGGLAKAKQTASKPVASLEQTSGPDPVPDPVPVSEQVTADYDSLTTPAGSSSSADLILTATATALAKRATSRTGTVQSYANGIAARMKRERIDDLAICVAEGWSIEDSVRFMIDGTLPVDACQYRVAAAATHRDPDCDVCDIDGFFRNDEDRLERCACLRTVPYLAEVIQLREESAS